MLYTIITSRDLVGVGETVLQAAKEAQIDQGPVHVRLFRADNNVVNGAVKFSSTHSSTWKWNTDLFQKIKDDPLLKRLAINHIELANGLLTIKNDVVYINQPFE